MKHNLTVIDLARVTTACDPLARREPTEEVRMSERTDMVLGFGLIALSSVLTAGTFALAVSWLS